MRKKVFGGRGNLGIVNGLRRQLIHLVNWELGTSGDGGLVLRLLGLLIGSVGSDHYRSISAMEILQCMDGVIRTLDDFGARNSWVLLLSNIGKRNVIFRDFALYRTLEILDDREKSEVLQSLEAKNIYWKMGNSFLYTMYCLLLREEGEVENREVRECMENCLKEGFVPPLGLVESYLRRNSCRDLLQLEGFEVTEILVGYLMRGLSDVGGLSRPQVRDYTEFLSGNQGRVERRIQKEARRNPFGGAVEKALTNVIRGAEKRDVADGFFHKLNVESAIESIESSPWNIDSWRGLSEQIRRILVVLSGTRVLDRSIGVGRILEEAVLNLASEGDAFREVASFFGIEDGPEDSGEPDFSKILAAEPLARSFRSITELLVNERTFLRYFNFGSEENIRTEMHWTRLQVYFQLVVLNEATCYLRSSSPHSLHPLGPKPLDSDFRLETFWESGIFWDSSPGSKNTSKSTYFLLPILLPKLLWDPGLAESAIELIRKEGDNGGSQREFIWALELLRKMERRSTQSHSPSFTAF
ncbi:hypothetical protein HWI79_3345 [Cryptosporidium felis]|nr:hypothetical protein HWI79_3345 [Cryptosporidium felis]